MDIFEEMRNQIKINSERWSEIDALIVEMKKQLDGSSAQDLKPIIKTIILLSEQMRPSVDMSKFNEQITETEKSVNQILGSFKQK